MNSKARACWTAVCRPDFAVPMPSDDSTLREDEDPLDPGDLDLTLGPPAERIEEVTTRAT